MKTSPRERVVATICPENERLKAKVGGVADVNGEVPKELVKLGYRVIQISPFLHPYPESQHVASFEVIFGGQRRQIEVTAFDDRELPNVRHIIIHCDAMFSFDERGNPEIYHSDPSSRPFETDARRYALFGLAIAEATSRGLLGHVDVFHCHDWTAAFFLMLRRYHVRYRNLPPTRTVFSVHNIALQGVRPFSSLDAFFDRDEFHYDKRELIDPRWPDCFNPMAAGIRLADRIHVVSPTYAEEVLEPSTPPVFFGGEGLEADLQSAKRENRLYGILNGCDYARRSSFIGRDFRSLLELSRAAVLSWDFAGNKLSGTYMKLARIGALREPRTVVSCVSRIVQQKCLIMMSKGRNNRIGLQSILENFRERNALLIVLGKGEKEFESTLHELNDKYDNFVFLNGYSDDCAEVLLSLSDLFVNCASWEPCGLTQLLAMKNGIPCVVHRRGGLADTVVNNVTGFTFQGKSVTEQVDQFVSTTLEAVRMQQEQPSRWNEIKLAAAATRFPWSETASQYARYLYN